MSRHSFAKTPVFPRHAKGFSLLEVLLAVTIAIGLGSMQLSQLKRDTESKQAQVVGQQLRTVGNAFNAYIAQNFGKLTTYTSQPAPGTPQYPGPVACNASTKMCTITSDTLRRSGLLPASFSGRNSYGSTYNYYIRVGGDPSKPTLDGLVVTNDPYSVGGAVRHDMIGTAMLEAGADSGSTRTVANQVNGYNGTWLETSFPQVNQVGLLAYRVGYGASNNSAYLRTDGSIPMEKDLRMGGNNIIEVNGLDGTGQIAAGSFFSKSGATDAIILNQTADPKNETNRTQLGISGNRLKITNEGGVELVNPTGNYTDLYAGNITGTGNLGVGGDGVFNGDISGRNLSVSAKVTAYGDVVGKNRITADNGFGTVTGSYVTTNGDISTQTGKVTTKDLIVTGKATIATDAEVNGELTVRGDIVMQKQGGESGWTFDPNSNTITVLNSASLMANNITANGYLRTNALGTVGAACNQRGEIRTDNTTGQVIACNGARFVASAPLTHTYSVTGNAGSSSVAVCAANERVTGCAPAYISRGTIDDPTNAAIISVVNNQCSVQAPGGSNVTLQAVAVCSR